MKFSRAHVISFIVLYVFYHLGICGKGYTSWRGKNNGHHGDVVHVVQTSIRKSLKMNWDKSSLAQHGLLSEALGLLNISFILWFSSMFTFFFMWQIIWAQKNVFSLGRSHATRDNIFVYILCFCYRCNYYFSFLFDCYINILFMSIVFKIIVNVVAFLSSSYY